MQRPAMVITLEGIMQTNRKIDHVERLLVHGESIPVVFGGWTEQEYGYLGDIRISPFLIFFAAISLFLQGYSALKPFPGSSKSHFALLEKSSTFLIILFIGRLNIRKRT